MHIVQKETSLLILPLRSQKYSFRMFWTAVTWDIENHSARTGESPTRADIL
jgi:hypothetical protein